MEDGPNKIGEGTLVFKDGRLDPASAKIGVTYALPSLATQSITLDFSEGVTSFASGTTSTLTVSGQGRLHRGHRDWRDV